MRETELADGGVPGEFSFAVRVPAEWSYPVHYAAGATEAFGRTFDAHFPDARAIVLTDHQVSELYGARLRASFRAVGRKPDWITVAAGERIPGFLGG